jgi:hypothetical protein
MRAPLFKFEPCSNSNEIQILFSVVRFIPPEVKNLDFLCQQRQKASYFLQPAALPRFSIRQIIYSGACAGLIEWDGKIELTEGFSENGKLGDHSQIPLHFPKNKMKERELRKRGTLPSTPCPRPEPD